jgi:hydroxymethylpyrimidine/phosphomethylpyrimidine kinase
MTIAASDPSGGAGIQADILTLASMGCHPVSVLTAITIQDSVGVEDVLPLDPEWVVDQARCILEDMPVAAFKIGLLASVEIAAGIAEVLSDYPDIPLVLDPVLASGRGDEFANDDVISAIRELIIPQSTIITPNSLEARRLAHNDDAEEEELSLELAAKRLLDSGCEYVLITGAHENTLQVINTLYHRNGVLRSDVGSAFRGATMVWCTLASSMPQPSRADMRCRRRFGKGRNTHGRRSATRFAGMGRLFRIDCSGHAKMKSPTAAGQPA